MAPASRSTCRRSRSRRGLTDEPLIDTNVRVEYDVARGRGLQMVSLGGNVNAAAVVRRRQLTATAASIRPNHCNVHPGHDLDAMAGRTGHGHLQRQLGHRAARTSSTRASWLSYLAQCCGLQFEFQKFNYARARAQLRDPVGPPVQLAFILAGLGTFSNFFGAFGGQR